MNLSNYQNKNGVFIITPINNRFSDNYIALREKENRILSHSNIKKLPLILNENAHYKEWLIRQKTTTRFLKYIKDSELSILDLGCGNGWFSNKMAINKKNKVIGLDVNIKELEQANSCFKKDNLDFIYYDIFIEDINFHNQFDLITLNASVQYFPDFEKLIKTLKQFLKPNGEIHILDSPFYDVSEIDNAKKRTLNYYTKMGFPEMANHYFHHSKEKIKNFDVLFKPNKKSLINKILGKNDSPFLWLKLKI